MSNIQNMPVYRAIVEYAGKQPTPFHTPGHKLGKGLPEGPFRDMGFFDLTEIPGTDNLHFPEGAIQEAQVLAADAFGAEESFFLVNGSTVGVHAMIMGVCGPGDKLIVSRDCHKSVINGLILAGAIPVYIRTGFNREFGISTGTLVSEVQKALDENPDAAGVLITRPNYYGLCCDIEELVRVVHARGKILAVDEAHGAHLRFGDHLPLCAMDAGADICVQSAHKTLPAFTQGAYLHIKGSRIDREKIRFYLRVLQTSSPSYILMASLDMAREIMQSRGYGLLGQLRHSIGKFRDKAGSIKGIRILGEEHVKESKLDTTRLVVSVKNLGITGFDMEKTLRERYNIQVEMADLYNIVCIGTVADDEKDFELLERALREMTDRVVNPLPPLTDIYVRELTIPPQGIDMKQMAGRKTKKTVLREAEGRTSSVVVTPYPPGIPVICPGEIIMADSIEYIYNIVKAGGTVNGLSDQMEISVLE